MKISFVIVTRNVSKFIGGCLDSVFSTAGELESLDIETDVIVVDNGSTDETPSAAKAAQSGIKVIRFENNRGYAVAAAKGVDAAAGDLIFFVDPCVEILPGSVRRILDHMETNPDCGIAGGKVVDQQGVTLKKFSRFPSCISKFASAFGICCCCGKDYDQPADVASVSFAIAAVRKSLFKKLGTLDSRFAASMADTDLCRRAARALNPTWKVAYIPQARARVLDRFAMKPEVDDFDLYGVGVVRKRVRSEMLYFWKHYCVITSCFFALLDIVGHSIRYVVNLLPKVGSPKKRAHNCVVICETAKAIVDTQLGSQYPTTPWE